MTKSFTSKIENMWMIFVFEFYYAHTNFVIMCVIWGKTNSVAASRVHFFPFLKWFYNISRKQPVLLVGAHIAEENHQLNLKSATFW